MDHPPPRSDEPIYRNMRGPNLWPDNTELPGFRPAIRRYINELEQLADTFKILIAEALDLEPTTFTRLFDEQSNSRLMLARYTLPSTSPDDDRLRFQGIGPHKDSGFLTFLFQGTTHSGLEAQNKTGNWVPICPLPGHLVVNVGRQLEALTKGVCQATTHRVSLQRRHFLDSDGKALGPRYSFPFFQILGLDLNPGAASITIPPHIADLVKDEKVRSDAAAYFQRYFKDGIGNGVFAMRILRHPAVAHKWYPGILESLQEQQSQ
ncbi:hypothetical protein EYZ11_004688 [Aspergillus tanneri]|nr:hypothetical protein EYZ11_004688 [Aspergillus tanneri]